MVLNFQQKNRRLHVLYMRSVSFYLSVQITRIGIIGVGIVGIIPVGIRYPLYLEVRKPEGKPKVFNQKWNLLVVTNLLRP